MSIYEIVSSGGGILLIVLTLIQIAPVKLNPWSAIARVVGRALNGEVIQKLDVHEADSSRYHILRFNDEILHHVRHTEEHFNQVIEDIDNYEAYYRQHPEYPNNKAVFAIDNIKKTYWKCKKENSFL